MSLTVPREDCQECPKCGELSAYRVNRNGWVRLECDECGFDELIQRPKEFGIKDAKQMVFRGLV